MLVSGQSEESITPIHEVAAEQGVRVHDGGLSADNRSSMQMNHKEDLKGGAALTPQRDSMCQVPDHVFLCNRLTKPRACLRPWFLGMEQLMISHIMY